MLVDNSSDFYVLIIYQEHIDRVLLICCLILVQIIKKSIAFTVIKYTFIWLTTFIFICFHGNTRFSAEARVGYFDVASATVKMYSLKINRKYWVWIFLWQMAYIFNFLLAWNRKNLSILSRLMIRISIKEKLCFSVLEILKITSWASNTAFSPVSWNEFTIVKPGSAPFTVMTSGSTTAISSAIISEWKDTSCFRVRIIQNAVSTLCSAS